jgi:hypothetical protein
LNNTLPNENYYDVIQKSFIDISAVAKYCNEQQKIIQGNQTMRRICKEAKIDIIPSRRLLFESPENQVIINNKNSTLYLFSDYLVYKNSGIKKLALDFLVNNKFQKDEKNFIYEIKDKKLITLKFNENDFKTFIESISNVSIKK